jgi:hypothetical protein
MRRQSCLRFAVSDVAAGIRIGGTIWLRLAQAQKADMQVSRLRSLIDSQGRDTVARLEAANYAPRFWAEAFAMSEKSAEAALDVMLRDQAACRGLTAAAARDAGVASVGDVWVIVWAAE